jgi:hypothetical protein
MQLGDWRVKITLAFAGLSARLMGLAYGATLRNQDEACERLMVASSASAVAGFVALNVFLLGSWLYWRAFDKKISAGKKD